jgi:stage II sporulation protein P
MKIRNKKILEKYIFVIIFIAFLSLAISSFVMGLDITNNSSGNSLYLELLYSEFPLMKVIDNKNMDTPSNGILYNNFLSFIGLDVSDPLSIIGKEIAMLNIGLKVAQSPNNRNESANETLQPYKLSDGEITMDSTDNNNNSNDISDLPNRIVTVYEPKLKKKLSTSNPEVLIYHSHTSEAYEPAEGGFTRDNNLNVCEVGSLLQEELQNNYGIATIHDTTINDMNYLQSYSKSAITLDKYLKKYKNFKVIIDMHRDSGLNKRDITTKMNGENVAKMMFVMTSSNPHSEKNMALANKLMDISNTLFPGFCKGIFTYEHGINYFNQNKSNAAVLIEVGSNINTIDEAKASSKYIARIIGQYINGGN